MASSPRVVAELGRPETPAETADRKAEASRAYRSSQNTRNLIAALLATLAVVAVIVLGVPRGEAPERPPIDVVAVAADVEATHGVDVVVPTVPADWRVNVAEIDPGDISTWTVVYALPADADFLRVAQGFGADEAWASRVLRGEAPVDTVTIDGIVWDRYEIADPASTGNVTAALGTAYGDDHVLVYGATRIDDLETVAASLATQLRTPAGSTG
ncbi:MAG: DUF4245 family protein [Microbacterium sp.]|uniref:DUF4245 family protein n=1 Tax=Microbacterium sp. TaxID=51671 RepID=UPI003A855D43